MFRKLRALLSRGDRRRRERRAEPYRHQVCGQELRIVGTSQIGGRIYKCPTCGTMDRRLPDGDPRGAGNRSPARRRRATPADLLERSVGGRPIDRHGPASLPALVLAGVFVALVAAGIFSVLRVLFIRLGIVQW